MKVCYVGQLKHKFILKVDVELDEVIEVKSEILERLGLSTPDDGYGTGINSTNPWMKKIKLFSLKGGLELSNRDRMESIQGQKYLYYSFGEPFDHQVRMEFIDIERKLGEGGFGSVYLGHDKLLNQQVAIKLLNFGSSIKNSNMITKEIDALGQLRHKNIVKLLDYFPLPKKQQLIVVMEYLKGGELDVLWKAQPMRRFSERNAYSLFIQLMTAIDYCHNSKIIHRDIKFQNVMLAEEPKYDKNNKLDVSSVNLKVVDFGIFGSISGNRLENINFGSLRFMAPELLQGDIKSTTKIDIWSLGLMLHAMVFGFLPFNANDRKTLENQILNDQIEYATLKKLKTSSIKNEVRRALNIILKGTSDELIDLIERMLKKDPEQRIDNLSVFEHPWVMKYRYDPFDDSSSNEDAQIQRDVSARAADKNNILDTNSDFFGEEKMQETNFDSDPVQLDNKSSRGTSSPNSFMNSDMEKGKVGRSCINQILKNHFMFNIEEHDNETTGNFVKVDLKQKQPVQKQESSCVQEEEEATAKAQRFGCRKKNSKIAVIRHVSLRKTNANLNDDHKEKDQQRPFKRSNLLVMDDKRKNNAGSTQQYDPSNHGDTDSNQPNLSSQIRKHEDTLQAQQPQSQVQNTQNQDGVHLNSQRSKTIKKKRKIMRKNNNNQATDGDYDADTNYSHQKVSRSNRKQNKQYLSNYGGGHEHGMLDKKGSNNFDQAMENCYIIEGPREGVEAQNIRLNVAMEKSSKMNMGNSSKRVQVQKIKSTQRVVQPQIQRQEYQQSTIDKQKQQSKRDFLPILSKLQTNYDHVIQDHQSPPPVLIDKKTPNGQSNTALFFSSNSTPFKDTNLRTNNDQGPTANYPASATTAPNQIIISQLESIQQLNITKHSNLAQETIKNINHNQMQLQVPCFNKQPQSKMDRITQQIPIQKQRKNSDNIESLISQQKLLIVADDEQPFVPVHSHTAEKQQKALKPIIKIQRAQIQSFSCDKTSNSYAQPTSVLPLNSHAKSDIGNHLVAQSNNQTDCSFLPVPNPIMRPSKNLQNRSQQSQSPRQNKSLNQNLNIVINNKELIIGSDSPLRLKRKNFDLMDQGSATVKGQQPLLQSFDQKINVNQLDSIKPTKQPSFMSNKRSKEPVNPANGLSTNQKIANQPNSLVNLPLKSVYCANPITANENNLPRRDILFYKAGQMQKQLQFKTPDMQLSNANQLTIKQHDQSDLANHLTFQNDNFEKLSSNSGMLINNFRKQQIPTNNENQTQNSVFEHSNIVQNQSDENSVCSDKSNDDKEILNPSRLEKINIVSHAQSPVPNQNAVLSLTQQNTENSVAGGSNHLNINGYSHGRRATSGMPAVFSIENSPGLLINSGTYNNTFKTQGFKYVKPLSRQSKEQTNHSDLPEGPPITTPFQMQAPLGGQNILQQVERSRTQDGTADQFADATSQRANPNRYQFESINKFLPQMKEKRVDMNLPEKTIIVTPLKKMSDQTQQFAIINSRSSKKNADKNSTAKDLLLKQYQTIENSQGGKSQLDHQKSFKGVPSLSSTMKNNTQTNFNPGSSTNMLLVPGSTANISQNKFTFKETTHKKESGSVTQGQGGPEILMGQQVYLGNHNEMYSRGTTRSGAARTNQKSIFQIKGQGLQALQSSVGGPINALSITSIGQPQARLTQSDMKRTRNLTQNDEQFEDQITSNNLCMDSKSHQN